MSRMMMMVLIAYNDGFKNVHDYFRVVLKSEEKSKRILQLTEDSLANYTVWKKGGAQGCRCQLEGGGAAQQRDDPRKPQELPGLAAQRAQFFDRFPLDNIRHQE